MMLLHTSHSSFLKRLKDHRKNWTALRLSLCFALLYLSSVSFADTLYFRAGEQAPGRLLKMTGDTIEFEGQDGVKTYPKAEVLKVQLQRSRMFDEIQSVDQITDSDLRACIENQPGVEQYPSAGSVSLLLRQTYDLTEPGVYKDTVRAITKVLQQRGENVATKSIWYFEDVDEPRIDFALTVTDDGRVLHLDDAAFKNESIYASYPDYRRLARYRFACKEPRPGSILDVQHTVVRKLNDVVRPFYNKELFRAGDPVLRKEVVVLVPEDRENEIAYELRGPEVVSRLREVRDGVVRLTWQLEQAQEGILNEPLMPPIDDYAPVLTLGEKCSWDKIGRFYTGVVEGGPTGLYIGYELHSIGLEEMLGAVREKAQELKQSGGIEAIHNYVARNIQTIAVPQRSFRMIPHAPGDTLKRGLANALDKNFLYYAMLRAVDVDCSFALVRGRSLGSLAESVPSLHSFNQSAVYLKDMNKFTTAVSELLPFGNLSGELHGASAIVFESSGAFLTTTQQPSPAEELDETHFEANLDSDGNLELMVEFAGKANSEAWLRALKDYDEQFLRNQFQQVATILHPSAVLKEYSTTDFADLTIAPSISLQCYIPGYAVKAGEELMLLNLPAIRYTASDVGKQVREHGLFWSHVQRYASQGTITVPDGFEVYSLPQDVAFDSTVVSYKARLDTNNGSIAFKDAYDLKVHRAPSEVYGDYKKCKELRAKLPIQRIILTKK